jgi:hypothetical protein
MNTAHRSREIRLEFWRAFVAASFFIIIIGANLYIGGVVVAGSLLGQPAAKNPAGRYKTARFIRPLRDGTFCRYTVFNNRSAESVEDGIERCATPTYMSREPAAPKFSWGAK